MKDLQQIAERSHLYFQFGGQLRSFNFGSECWDEYCKQIGCTTKTAKDTFHGPQTAKALFVLALCSITASDKIKGREASVTDKDVISWITDDPQQFIHIMEVAAKHFLSLSDRIEFSTRRMTRGRL